MNYGNPSMEDCKWLQQVNYLEELYERFNTTYPPHLNASNATVDELQQILSFQQPFENAAQEMKDRYLSYDTELPMIFERFYTKAGIDDTGDIIRQVLEDIMPVIMKLKYTYQRPRPFQLADYHKLRLFPQYSSCMLAPAYPSGHTMIAYVLGEVLGSLYPQTYQPSMKLADSIAKSRIVVGANYASDNAFAIKVAAEIVRDRSFTKKFGL